MEDVNITAATKLKSLLRDRLLQGYSLGEVQAMYPHLKKDLLEAHRALHNSLPYPN